jgi:L-rhamnose mutarotase
LLTIDDEHSDFEQFDGVHYYMQKLTPDEIPQEWRDTCQQCLEQQMSTAQEILKQQKTQEPEIPQF